MANENVEVALCRRKTIEYRFPRGLTPESTSAAKTTSNLKIE